MQMNPYLGAWWLWIAFVISWNAGLTGAVVMTALMSWKSKREETFLRQEWGQAA